MLEAVSAVRKLQVDEAKENLEASRRAKELAGIRKGYYESRDFMNPGEITATTLNAASLAVHTAGTIADILAGAMFLIPDFKVGASGFGGSPHFAAEVPAGTKVANSGARGANGLYNIAQILDKTASLAATIAGYQRRKEDWDLQRDLASKELEQIDRQIAAAELRLALAEKEAENQQLQIENSKAVDELMRSKYTNEDLYQWHVGQISGVYFQTYKLAYDLAKRAERCLRFELGLADSSYISFGYWDSLKKGLLAGEKLQYDLRRLEIAHCEQNRRELELTKHVSLAQLDPLALVMLRETGRCFFQIPEELFDLDYPGHYFRRIKSVTITLPAVRGPYTTLSCTLRLVKSSTRVATGGNDYPRLTDDDGLPVDDPRFIESAVPVNAIATSGGHDDSGMFELAFRDERYLPFEGAGAISEWSLELFNDLPSNNPDPSAPDFGRPLRQFDYSSISDAVMHIKYTAREDMGPLKNAAITHLRNHLQEPGTTPGVLMLDLRRDFATEWARLLRPTSPATGNVFALEVSTNLFPFRDARATLQINSISLAVRGTGTAYSATISRPAASTTLSLTRLDKYGGLYFDTEDVSADSVKIDPTLPPDTWQLTLTGDAGNLVEDPTSHLSELQDALLVFGYQWV
jgi:hypothetical protein